MDCFYPDVPESNTVFDDYSVSENIFQIWKMIQNRQLDLNQENNRHQILTKLTSLCEGLAETNQDYFLVNKENREKWE